MTVTTALQLNLDKVEAAARDIERMEERAGRLRAELLRLLVQPCAEAPGAESRLSR